MMQWGRPQDWGNAKQWMYRAYEVEAFGYHGVIHCWLDHQVPEDQHREIFVPMLHRGPALPGEPKELCGNEFMEEEDFWDKSWGKMPPFYEGERLDVAELMVDDDESTEHLSAAAHAQRIQWEQTGSLEVDVHIFQK